MSVQPKSAAEVQSEAQDEIQEIMKEIENLQKGMADAGTEAPEARSETSAEPDLEVGLEDFRGAEGEASMEETLAGMKEEEPASGSSLLDQAIESGMDAGSEHEEPSTEEHAVRLVRAHDRSDAETGEKEEELMSGKSSDGTMTMSLQGSMTLKLKYEVDGQEVTVSFQENVLRVQLADGTEFKIPVRSNRLRAV